MKKLFLFVLLSALTLFSADFCTRVVNGVPRIEQDGVPVRARWFYGCPGRTRLILQQGEQVIELKKEAMMNEKCEITFHFRFPKEPGEYFFDDFQVIDNSTGRNLINLQNFNEQPYGPFLSLPDKSWQIWPRDPKETHFGAEITDFPGEPGNKALRYWFAGDASDATLPQDPHLYRSPVPVMLETGKSYTIRCRVWSDHEVLVTPGYYIPDPIAYRACLSDAPGSNSAFTRQVKDAHDAGVDFVTTVVTIPWAKPGERQNFSEADKAIRYVLAANPNAFVIPRIRLDAPGWWMDAHPDELVKWSPDAKGKHNRTASVSSEVWLRDSLKNLTGLINYLEKHFPNNIAGYHICALNTWEWFYIDSWGQDLHGYAPCEQKAFREWLNKKYATDQALQDAWKDYAVTLATVQTPSPEARKNAARVTAVLDPGAAQPVIDHNQFLQDEVADAIETSAKLVRNLTGGKRLVLYFYGYVNIFGSMNRISACGHLNNRRILQCPDIDILVSPIDYADREEGGAALAMTPAESVLRAGKIWFYEDDTRTYLAANGSLAGVNRYVPTPEYSWNVLLRNTSEEIIRNFGCWWMDLAEVGWYDDPYLWTAMSTLKEMEEKKLANPRPFEPVIAATSSERSAVYTIDAFPMGYPAFSQIRSTLSRCGASNGMYYLEDVVKNGIPAKVVIVGNAWVMDAQERAALKEKLADKVVIWCHAPAIVDPETGFSLNNSQELTGFALRQRAKDKPVGIRNAFLGREAGLPKHWDVRAKATDCFSIRVQEGDEVLAKWEDDATPAVVRRGNHIFCASPEVPRELCQYALKLAGEHIYTTDEVVLYTDGVNLELHATPNTPETVQLYFPEAVSLKDIATGKMLTDSPVTTFILTMKFADTRVLEMMK